VPLQVLRQSKTPLDDLADNVRGNEVNSCPLREGLPDTLEAGAKVGRKPHDELAILGGADDRPGHSGGETWQSISASAVQSQDLLRTQARGNAAATNHRSPRPRANEVASTPARRKYWRVCRPGLSGQRSAGVTMR
jgi:hypothetical protein